MNFTKIASAAGFALVLGLAQAAVAQTATGTMAPAAPAAAAPMAAPAAPAAAAAPAAKPAKATKATSKTSSKLATDEQFKAQAEAAAHCPADTVVWASMTSSNSFHLSTSKYFGKTKHGVYACEKAAEAAGMHASKN